MNPFEQKLQQLVDGEITEIKITRDEFLMFRDAWLKREDRKCIIGEAAHQGNVTYRYDPNVL